jgi:hypothetical protein
LIMSFEICALLDDTLVTAKVKATHRLEMRPSFLMGVLLGQAASKRRLMTTIVKNKASVGFSRDNKGSTANSQLRTICGTAATRPMRRWRFALSPSAVVLFPHDPVAGQSLELLQDLRPQSPDWASPTTLVIYLIPVAEPESKLGHFSNSKRERIVI